MKSDYRRGFDKGAKLKREKEAAPKVRYPRYIQEMVSNKEYGRGFVDGCKGLPMAEETVAPPTIPMEKI